MNLDLYREELENRRAMYLIYNIIAFLFIIVSNLFLKDHGNGSDMAYGFAMGFAVGIQLICIVQLTKFSMVLKDEVELKKMYIKEHDERVQFIQLKSGSKIISKLALLISIFAIPMGFVNELIFKTMLAVAVAEALIAIGLKFYWKRKI